MEYSLSTAVSNVHALYQPTFSISSAGTVPKHHSGSEINFYNFYKRLLCSSDVFIHNVLCTFLYNNCDDGILFKSGFYRKSDAIHIEWGQPFRTMVDVSMRFCDFIVVCTSFPCVYSRPMFSVCLVACFGE